MSDNRDGNPSAQSVFGRPVQRDEPVHAPDPINHGGARWITVTSDEAREMAEQGERYQAGRHQADATSRAIDASRKQADLSRLVPPGTRDPEAYIAAMVAKSEAAQGAPVLDSSRVTSGFSIPTGLVFTSAQGFPRSAGAARPGDLLTVDLGGGVQTKMEVEHAVREGLIRRSAGGGYEGLSANEREQTQQDTDRAEQERKAAAEAALEAKRATGLEPDRETQSAIDYIGSVVPGEVQEGFIHDVVENGTLSLAQLSRAAESAGVPLEQAMAKTEAVYDGLKRQAVTTIASEGIAPHDAEEAFAWMQAHYPLEHKHAALALIRGSETAGLKALAAKFRVHRLQRS